MRSFDYEKRCIKPAPTGSKAAQVASSHPARMTRLPPGATTDARAG